jgi:ABC-type Fe3+-siderophore transport system permease subunit
MQQGYRDVEDIEITRVEKFLIFSLVIFLLIGGFWLLSQIESLVPQPVMSQNDSRYAAITHGPAIEDELGIPPLKREVEGLQKVANNRQQTLSMRTQAFESADRAYQYRREEYRTGLEAGHPDPDKLATYNASRQSRSRRLTEMQAAQKEVNLASGRLKTPQKRLDELQKTAYKLYDQRNRTRNLILFGLHFFYAGLTFLFAWKTWQRARQVHWRFLSLVTALLAASILQLIFLVFRYCWELFLQEYTLLGISVLGTVGCTLAIVALKRYLLNPERVAQNRLAAHDCPHCSTHFDPGQAHCWSCGWLLMEPCPHCGKPHLRMTPHCENCGQIVPLTPTPDAA